MVFDNNIEAKCKSLAEGAKEVVYLRKLFLELNALITLSTPISSPNASIHSNLKEAHISTELDTHLNCDN